MDWSSMHQVFPSLDSNGVRQRLMRLREDPGVEAYLLRLENTWYNMWVQNRGTPLLPDDHPDNIFEFDLIAHISYLRNHINKSSL
jgi:oxalate---CoA ligase